jgi:hypothetical protein
VFDTLYYTLMSRAHHYHVAPRYTGGSPAMVDEATAERVAKQEKQSIEYVLQGVEGETNKARAERLGLRGIAECRVEQGAGKKLGWAVLDLCTGERFFRLCTESLRKLGWRRYDDLTQSERAIVDGSPPSDIEDYKSAHYKFEMPERAERPGWKVVVYRPQPLRQDG